LKKLKNNSYILLILLLIWGCANRIQPTGGPKDEDPPKVITSQPQYGERNYKSQEVVIEFDEFVNLGNLKEQLIITPRINGDYDFKIHKRIVSLEFEEPFADSTTFTLNFREGIVDITESNPAENLLLAFSTGNLLDTLEITGTLIDLMTKVPIGSAIIGLYPIDDTLDIFTGPPYYFAQTNKDGNYVFKNIKDGDYRLYAFEDGNKNLICESEREAYAFQPQPITLDTAYIADTLNLQFLNIDTLKLTRTGVSGRYFNVYANKYLMDAKLQAENDSVIAFNYNDDHKSLKVYNTFSIKDSLKVFAELQDSLGVIAQDTFYLKFIESSRKADEYKVLFKEAVGSLKKKKITGEITFSKPIQSITLDSIVIRKDSITQYLITDSFSYKLDSLENILEYSIDIPQAVLDTLNKKTDTKNLAKVKVIKGARGKATYNLYFPKGFFMSIENDSSQASNKQLKFIAPETVGLINGSITTSYDSFTIQLLDSKMDVVNEHKNEKAYSFDEVKPGEYFIRILIDENGNGKWDMPDIRNNIPAERVILYQDETGASKTVIRANWEVTIDLSF
jgi:hypothetical protein